MRHPQTTCRKVTRRFVLVVLVGVLTALAGSVYATAEIERRSVRGIVVDAANVPIESAIVYLSNTRTKTVESYITQQDGAYRFQQMSRNDDYKLWARVNGEKSKVRTLSSFDGRSVFHVILKIDTKK